MPHYTEITGKLRSVHATNIEAAALIEELVSDLDKAREMLLGAQDLQNDLYEGAKIIRRLLSYADRTAENHPRAVTSAGQNARVRAGIWLAQYESKNATNPKVKPQITI
jgi:hypothetical protein